MAGRRLRRSPATGLIIAGGAGRRLGRGPKAHVELGGRALTEWVAIRLRSICDELIVSAGELSGLDHLGRVIRDYRPGEGPLAGLESGLAAARHDAVIVVGCDMPFLSADLLAFQLRDLEPGGATLLRVGGQPQPLHGVYSRSLAPVVARHLDSGARSLLSFLEGIPVRWVDEADAVQLDPSGRSSWNVNTAEDLSRAERELSPEGLRGPGDARFLD